MSVAWPGWGRRNRKLEQQRDRPPTHPVCAAAAQPSRPSFRVSFKMGENGVDLNLLMYRHCGARAAFIVSEYSTQHDSRTMTASTYDVHTEGGRGAQKIPQECGCSVHKFHKKERGV